jgi:1-acyl-sn-glycerol-3-phosphate acyltransferase
MIRAILQPFYTAFVLTSFIASLLLAFPVFLIVGIRDSARARKFIWDVVHYWSRGWLWIIGMHIQVQGTFPKGRKYVIVANHISYMDTLDIYAAIPEYFRTLAKKGMVKVPIFGFVYKQLAILVDRESAQSRAKSMRLMWRQLRNECHIMVFPEGTFNETDKPLKDFYDGAFRLALSSQTPILPMVFPDTLNRWHYSGWYKVWPGPNRAVFLHPVFTEGLTITDLPALKEKVYRLMEEELVRLSKT